MNEQITKLTFANRKSSLIMVVL